MTKALELIKEKFDQGELKYQPLEELYKDGKIRVDDYYKLMHHLIDAFHKEWERGYYMAIHIHKGDEYIIEKLKDNLQTKNQ